MPTSGSVPVPHGAGPAIDRTRRTAGASAGRVVRSAGQTTVAVALTMVGFVAYFAIELTYGRHIHADRTTPLLSPAPEQARPHD
jgi:hypothetical protein